MAAAIRAPKKTSLPIERAKRFLTRGHAADAWPDTCRPLEGKKIIKFQLTSSKTAVLFGLGMTLAFAGVEISSTVAFISDHFPAPGLSSVWAHDACQVGQTSGSRRGKAYGDGDETWWDDHLAQKARGKSQKTASELF